MTSDRVLKNAARERSTSENIPYTQALRRERLPAVNPWWSTYRRAVITGAPKCGKTSMAIERAIEARGSGRNVLVVCEEPARWSGPLVGSQICESVAGAIALAKSGDLIVVDAMQVAETSLALGGAVPGDVALLVTVQVPREPRAGFLRMLEDVSGWTHVAITSPPEVVRPPK